MLAPEFGVKLRAAGLAAIGIAVAALTWRLRPSSAPYAGSPDAAIVTSCSWLAWALAGYLAVTVVVVASGHLLGPVGAVRRVVPKVTPRAVRRLVDATLTFSAAAAVVGSSTAAQAAIPVRGHVVTEQAVKSPTGSALDWPGLTTAQDQRPARQHSEPQHNAAVVVQPGDTLWSIAARHLGGDASGVAITAAWHDWYAANRDVIGPNPSLIHPGQHLTPPR